MINIFRKCSMGNLMVRMRTSYDEFTPLSDYIFMHQAISKTHDINVLPGTNHGYFED